MAELKLKAVRREGTGKGASRRARAAGKIPAIVYGRDMEPVSIEVDRREFVSALRTDAGVNVLLDIEINGETTLALTRELQRDPVRGSLLHADFVKVDRTREIEVDVPIHLVGASPGVEQGGALEHQLFSAHVRCLPTNVPERVDADVSGLAIGDSLKIAELSSGRDFEILNDPDTVIAVVAAPVSEEELEAMEAAAGIEAEAPEEEAAEAEAPPEGAAAAEEAEEGQPGVQSERS